MRIIPVFPQDAAGGEQELAGKTTPTLGRRTFGRRPAGSRRTFGRRTQG